jgi:hypothetical protein
MSPGKPGNFGVGKSNKARRPITAAFIRFGESKLPRRWRKQLRLWPGATWFDAVAASMFRAAANGNVEAAREIREAVEGKTRLRIELSGEGGGPIVIADVVKKLFDKIAA